MSTETHGTTAPVLTMLLIAYNQAGTIRAAIEGALAQTYSPLEILISDDCSPDDTHAVMLDCVAGYQGPHQVRVLRSPVNLGIGAHLSHLALQAQGELLLVAAGDDVSLPQRCERMARIWQDSGRRLDLIACSLADMDETGQVHERISPSDLGSYRSVQDWLARPPHVIGAGQAWTRRLFERYGPLPSGVVAEDLLMVLRAIGSGGAQSTDEVLVRYRRGGISRKVRVLHAEDVIRRQLKNSRHAVVEYRQMLVDATVMGCQDLMAPWIAPRLQREELVETLYAQPQATFGTR
ncbi:MAG: hypothetical protein RJA44_1461, partial [Pseudomonadota bacterium]